MALLALSTFREKCVRRLSPVIHISKKSGTFGMALLALSTFRFPREMRKTSVPSHSIRGLSPVIPSHFRLSPVIFSRSVPSHFRPVIFSFPSVPSHFVYSKEYTYIVVKDTALQTNCQTEKFLMAFNSLCECSKLVFLTSALFQFYFAYCTPFKYIAMLEDKKIIFGESNFHELCQSVLIFSERFRFNDLHDIISANAIYMFSDLYAQDWCNLNELVYKDHLYSWYLKTFLFLETSKVFNNYELMEKHCAEVDHEMENLLKCNNPLQRFELARKICQKVAYKLSKSTKKQNQKTRLNDIVSFLASTECEKSQPRIF